MDLRRLRAGEWIAAAAGIALLVTLFLPWYERQLACIGRSSAGLLPCPDPQEVTAWEAFAVTDVVLGLVALAAVALFMVTALQRAAAVAMAYESLLTIAAGVAALLVVMRVLIPPGEGLSRTGGLWLGCLATLAVLGGSLVAMRNERLSKSGRPTDPTGVRVEAPPEIETLPAPPREGAPP